MFTMTAAGALLDSRGDEPDNVTGDRTDRLAARRHQVSTQWALSGCAGER